jgi:hypothetical protein
LRGAAAALLLGCAANESAAVDAAIDSVVVVVDSYLAPEDSIIDTSTLDASMEVGAKSLLDPVAACAPKGDACAAKQDERVFVGFRKDFFLPSTKYSEPNPDPSNGGRFIVASVAKVSGTVTSVTVDGADANTLLVEPKLEWFHVWPTKVKAGEPLWVSFHSRDPKWNSGGSATLVVKTDAGDALTTRVEARTSALRLTYVTTNDARDTLLVHLRNESDATKKLTKVLVNGRDVTEAACIAETSLAPKTSALITVPLCTAAPLGSPWTVVVEADDAVAVGAGRVLRPFFPIETWANSSDCPFPVGGKLDYFDKHRLAGIDTFFMYVGGTGEGCSYDTLKLVSEIAPAREDFWPFLNEGFAGSIADTSRLSGFLLGDEVDGEVYVDGKPKAVSDMNASKKYWALYPDVPTYIGSKTNRNVGAFAGVTDIQGSDFYVAACAPHITQFGTHPPLDAAYDYLKNTRDNHMPLPTWLYAQGLSPAWNKKAVIGGGEIVSQPDPQEILVQGFSAIAAGAKGLMWFQTNMKEATRVPARWDAIAYVSWVTRGVRALVRTGDLIGGTSATGPAIVDAVRAREGIVVPVISLKSESAPTDINCQLALGGGGAVPHWKMAAQTIAVSIAIPRDLGVAEVLEVTDTTVKAVTSYAVVGRTLTINGVALDNTTPARVYVLAASKAVAASIQSQLRK